MTTSLFSSQDIQAGIECYHSKRTRHGGSHQEGFLYGAALRYELFGDYHFFCSVDGRLAYGKLNGRSGRGSKLSSHQMDSELEGCIGGYYCFGACYPLWTCAAFGGGGYYYGTNHYSKPTAVPLKFCDTFSFLTAGSLIRWEKSASCAVTCIYKIREMLEGRSRVSNDPDFPSHMLPMNEERHHELSLTCAFKQLSLWGGISELSAGTFYRYRHYGKRPNYPFDFIDTKYVIYGVNVSLFHWF